VEVGETAKPGSSGPHPPERGRISESLPVGRGVAIFLAAVDRDRMEMRTARGE